MTITKYIVLNASQASDDSTVVGQLLYQCAKHDYGLARDDTNMFGIEYVSVSKDPTGDYSFFTIPREHLKELKDEPATN
jgi:hypothetical protein